MVSPGQIFILVAIGIFVGWIAAAMVQEIIKIVRMLREKRKDRS